MIRKQRQEKRIIQVSITPFLTCILLKSNSIFLVRTPFDTALEKLSKCANDSPSLVDVMQENLRELQTDKKYVPLFNAAPHTAAYLNRRIHDSTKFINGLRQALNADWSNPTWKSWDEIDTLFRPFKQQFVYAMMRFNCT